MKVDFPMKKHGKERFYMETLYYYILYSMLLLSFMSVASFSRGVRIVCLYGLNGNGSV